MNKRILPVLLVMALLIAALTITVVATETPVAGNEISAYANENMKGKFDGVDSVEAYCPACNKTVIWYALDKGMTGATSLHYAYDHHFLKTDITHSGGFFYAPKGSTVCLYLNGKNLASPEFINLQASGTLNLIGNGNEVVSGGGLGVWDYGCALDVRGGTLNLYGGTYTKTAGTTRPGPVAACSEAAGTINVYNGTTITGGANTAAGGNIGLYFTGSTVNIYGGTVSDGAAPTGGNIGVPAAGRTADNPSITGCTINLYGGEIKGGTATGNGGNICLESASTVNLSGATVTGGTAANWGGNCYGEGGAKFVQTAGTVQTGSAKYGGNFGINNAYITLSGGTIKNGTASDRAGNLYLSQYVGSSIGGATFTGGTIEGGTGVNGGSIFLESGSKVTMTNVTLTGGYGTGLGGMFHVSNAQLTLDNCTVSGGRTDKWGGNIYADTSGTKVIITGGTTISGGSANMGGNITIHDKATLEIQSGQIAQGTAANYGGNIFMSSGTLTQTGGTVKKGASSTDRGGNLYVSSAATATITGATYEDGTASVYGGNIFNGGTLTVTDTAITGGTAARGGNVHCNTGATFTNCTIANGTASYGGNLRIDSTATCTFTGCTIKNGMLSGSSSGGGNMDTRGVCTFENCTLEVAASASGNGSHFYNAALQTFTNCTITGGTTMNDGDVTLINTQVNVTSVGYRTGKLTLGGNTTISQFNAGANTKLYVKSDFTGEVNFASMVGAPAAPIYGKALGDNFTAEGAFTGKIICTFDMQEPWVCNKGGKLMFASCRTVKDGAVTWYADSTEALAAYDGTGYLQPIVDGTIPVAGTCTVDLAGTNQTITGTGTVTLFDSANADFKTYGSATVTGPTVANDFATQVQGNTYYTIINSNTYTFHRLENKISGVTLRPANAGIYYTGYWACDDALKALIRSYGVAVSVAGQPGTDFEENSLYTAHQPSEFESGAEKNGVLITNIFKTDAADNAQRGQRAIYASTYITFQNGESTYVAVDTSNQRYSLHDALTMVESNKNDYAIHAQTLEDFMTQWSQYGVTGENWNFDFTVAPELVTLSTLYAGKNVYQGEMHDHANTGGRADGKQTLQTWIDGMNKLKMDFATIVDHDQSRHMYLDEWKQATFIGGTETTGWLTDTDATNKVFHMNLIFADVEKYEAFIMEYADVFQPQIDEETGGIIFKNPPEGTQRGDPEFDAAYTYLPETKAYMMELAQSVHDHGGFFAHVHPKQSLASENPLDYWFGDYTGIEVQYTYNSTRDGAKPQANYKLWTDLLDLGKKVYATAGNDEHNMPTVKALTTIYAPENTPAALVEQMRAGNFNPGPIGIRMAIGDIPMGKEGDFTGKKLAFVIGDIHESELKPDHTYCVYLFRNNEKVASYEMPATGENFYQVVEIDDTADFYRLEIIDETANSRVSISQPIWNTK